MAIGNGRWDCQADLEDLPHILMIKLPDGQLEIDVDRSARGMFDHADANGLGPAYPLSQMVMLPHSSYDPDGRMYALALERSRAGATLTVLAQMPGGHVEQSFVPSCSVPKHEMTKGTKPGNMTNADGSVVHIGSIYDLFHLEGDRNVAHWEIL